MRIHDGRGFDHANAKSKLIKSSLQLCCRITPRSTAGGLSEGERSSPSQLHFKATKRDGFLGHRA
jgi:hypothetical protein